MKIQQLPLDQIKPYWRNPRDNAKALHAVKASITEFGMNQPLVLDREKVIIAGHTRYRALVELGHERAPVVIVDLDPARAKAYRIADNKTSELAEWNNEKLTAELREIADEVSMDIYFPGGELEQLIAGASEMKFDLPTQEQIDKASDKAASQFDKVEATASADQVEVICPHCGETSFIPREHLEREMVAKVAA
jgi:hypothetical protein